MSWAPRDFIEEVEKSVLLPTGAGDRFNGYGLMGLPFESGHILVMRRFPVSSVGPGYTSVWHRSPAGDWVFYADAPPRQSCTRFFGLAAADAIETPITLEWKTGSTLAVSIQKVGLEWMVELESTATTRAMNAIGRVLPSGAWSSPAILSAIGLVAGTLLRAGRVRLYGSVPNGQRFIANPKVLWSVSNSTATLDGESFGAPAPVEPQARLGDFLIPQRGILAIGQAYFDAFDPARHSQSVCRADRTPATR
ncbi:MAG: hypothetical protein ACSLFK_11885 [Gemmatimonadaceae bacterium]